MHDIVRDLMRERIGDEDALRGKQRAAVEAFVAACPADGWAKDDVVGKYAALALAAHMSEALQAERLEDAEAQSWLDTSNDAFGHVLVRSAAEAFGHKVVTQLGERCELGLGTPLRTAAATTATVDPVDL